MNIVQEVLREHSKAFQPKGTGCSPGILYVSAC